MQAGVYGEYYAYMPMIGSMLWRESKQIRDLNKQTVSYRLLFNGIWMGSFSFCKKNGKFGFMLIIWYSYWDTFGGNEWINELTNE